MHRRPNAIELPRRDTSMRTRTAPVADHEDHRTDDDEDEPREDAEREDRDTETDDRG